MASETLQGPVLIKIVSRLKTDKWNNFLKAGSSYKEMRCKLTLENGVI